MPTDPIFKAHNPGCNCCPEEDEEPPPQCHYAVCPVSPFLFISSFGPEIANNRWWINGAIRSEHTDLESPFHVGVKFSAASSSLYPWMISSGPWSVEGNQEAMGGDQMQGPVESDGTYRFYDGGSSMPPPCGTGPWGPIYPTFEDGRDTDLSTWFTCGPAWSSGTALVRCGSPLYLCCPISQVDAINGVLFEPVTPSFYVNPDGSGPYQTPRLYDPNLYWPWETCE